MDPKELIRKLLAGETLTPEEKAYLKDYNPDNDENRIPKTRLDQEITKRKNAEKEVTDLTTRIDELTVKVEELENSGLGEAEKAKKEAEKELNKLKQQISTLTAERDEAQSKLTESEFKTKVSEIAAKHNFVDSEYLGFKVKADEIDLADEKAVTAFVKGLEKSSPNLFKSNVKPGGGTGKGGKVDDDNQSRLKELLGKKELTSNDLAEIAELEEQSNAANGGETGE